MALNEKEREAFALNDKEREALAVSEEEADSANAGSLSYDEIVELAMDHSGAPLAELDQVMENGNLYIHLYEDMGDHTATIDWYEIDPKTLKGTNFIGDPVDLMEGDAGEGTEIADGEYVTDDEYEGELSEDGKVMTVTTALWAIRQVNVPVDYYSVYQKASGAENAGIIWKNRLKDKNKKGGQSNERKKGFITKRKEERPQGDGQTETQRRSA